VGHSERLWRELLRWHDCEHLGVLERGALGPNGVLLHRPRGMAFVAVECMSNAGLNDLVLLKSKEPLLDGRVYSISGVTAQLHKS
jgi:hypothetical protein